MYKAIVARIHTRPIPGADNIRLGTVAGYQVIVGGDVEEGQLGLFFEGGGQLSEGFAQANDLIRRKDADGNHAGGYFEDNRKVRAIKMRGARSEGFWCPLSLLDYTGVDYSNLTEGMQFDELGGFPICNKFITRATRNAARSNTNARRGETPMFKKHVDTEAFKRGVGLIPKDSIIYITEKLHGTSFRFGHILEEKPVEFRGLRKWLSRWLFKDQEITDRQWVHLNGSRNVILDVDKESGSFYGTDKFRLDATKDIVLRKGEVIYGELVGYTDTGKPIMDPQDTTKLKDKAIEKAFGKTMTYSYGCIPGQCMAYVYRITQVNEDGHVVELSWPQVVARCRELGLNPVPSVSVPLVYSPDVWDSESLSKIVSAVTEQSDGAPYNSLLDPSHIREGVVVRYESEWGMGWLKNKCFTFGVLEGYLKESDNYVDAEEVA